MASRDVHTAGACSAEEMDEIRKKNIAYEYLCHLEEAKIWLEAILNEELPPSTELEETLRNGVYLAKLGHFLAPQLVPLSKIYDSEQRRFKCAGLQFRHTDNINYWLKSLIESGLPKTFHPETTDVYDKKGMPKVIYCLHALSTHLFKLGKAPLIQDLYGKVNFTDAEICNMKQTLDDNGTPMPVFQKIGNLLTHDTADDVETLHNAIIQINDAVDRQDINLLLNSLKQAITIIPLVKPQYAEEYLDVFREAKTLKVTAALNRSSSESYTSDIYDELLTLAEIQGHLTSVNVSCSRNELVDAARKGDTSQFLSALGSPWFELKNFNPGNSSFYIEEILQMEDAIMGYGTMGVCDELQRAVSEGNKKADLKAEISRELRKIEKCLASGTTTDLLALLKNEALGFEINEFACPLYFEELRAELVDSGQLVYEEMKTFFRTLNVVAVISESVDAGNHEQTWTALSHPNTHFSGIDSHFKVQYWQSLTQTRQFKLLKKCECPILTYFDIQNCIDSVNQQYESSNLVIEALHSLNCAVAKRDIKAVANALQNSALGLSDNISSNDSVLCFIMLEKQQKKKQKEGMELWLDDIQQVMKAVLIEVQEAQRVCVNMSQINMALQQNDDDFTKEALIEAGFNVNSASKYQYYSVLKKYKEKKMANFKCSWIKHHTKNFNTVYLNLEDLNYSWTKPNEYEVESQYLSRKDVEKILQRIHHGKKAYVDERLIIKLQSYIRGHLLRKSLCKRKKEKCAIVIQAWWRGVIQRTKYKQLVSDKQKLRKSLKSDNILIHYQREESKIIKIQAIWRGHRARKAFVSLFHKATPSFNVVRQFAPYLNVNNDDYIKEMQLQTLKGQVTQTIRHNQQLAKQLDTMDIKIGLLVQNRISLQDVVAHSKNLNDLALKNSSSETFSIKGLKSLTKDSRRRLEGYQHLFYMLQTCPNYLAKLLFCLPRDRTSVFIKTIIWSLFNFGSNLREEYLLLRLFRSALQEEIRVKFAEPAELITSASLVLHMVADHARQAVGSNSLQNIIGPLVQKVLDDKTLVISTNPVDIYRTWRNQQEMQKGVVSDLPPSVSPEQALAHSEVQKRLMSSIHALKSLTMFFLDHITQSINSIPYGLLYIARVLRDALEEKFPDIPEKDILKVVGNLVYYRYINPAIIGPETYGIITLTADNSLSNIQRLNLASIAKILQFAAVTKGFGEESKHLMCLNSFIIECNKKFKNFFRKCCNVEDLDVHFSLHQYSEATLITRPVIYITLQEICDTHKLLVDYLDNIAPDPMDPLLELLEDMGPPPTLATLIGGNPTDISLSRFAKNEICLTLVNKFEVPENDVTDVNKLFIKTKEMLLYLLPCLKGETLLDALTAEETDEQVVLYKGIQNRSATQTHPHKMNYTTSCISENTLQSCKMLLRQNLVKLELEGLVSQDDQYQAIITAIAHDICNHGKYRGIMRKELQTLWHIKSSLDQKTKFYEEQVTLYNQYIEKCLENLNAGKRNVHTLKSSNSRRKVKSKLVLKYTASRLHEKGILLEVDGLPASQFKNVQFEISPTNNNGIFTICGRFMGVDLEKVDIDVQHLLQLQFNGESVVDIFGKAKVNVNLLLFLLNKKFYGKT